MVLQLICHDPYLFHGITQDYNDILKIHKSNFVSLYIDNFVLFSDIQRREATFNELYST